MNEPIFNRSALMPGMIAGRMSKAAISRAIVLRTSGMVALSAGTAWSHDAILIAHNRRWYLGDAEMGRSASLTPLEEWEESAARGDIRAIVLWPTGATQAQGEAAAWWWQTHVCGSSYDSVAIRDLAWRYLAERFGRKVGHEDRWYCTEGCRDSWMMGAQFDPWAPKLNVTPGTTRKRLAEGRFCVADGALTEFGRRYSIVV